MHCSSTAHICEAAALSNPANQGRAAGQLDLAKALMEVYGSDPTFLAPDEVWAGLRQARPDLAR